MKTKNSWGRRDGPEGTVAGEEWGAPGRGMGGVGPSPKKINLKLRVLVNSENLGFALAIYSQWKIGVSSWSSLMPPWFTPMRPCHCCRQWWANLKSNVTLESQVFTGKYLNRLAKSQIPICLQVKSQIKYQIFHENESLNRFSTDSRH